MHINVSVCCIITIQLSVYTECIVDEPFVLLPMALESFPSLKDVVKGNENGECLANVLEYSLHQPKNTL